MALDLHTPWPVPFDDREAAALQDLVNAPQRKTEIMEMDELASALLDAQAALQTEGQYQPFFLREYHAIGRLPRAAALAL